MPKPPITPPKGSDPVKEFVPSNPADIDDIFADLGGEKPPVEKPPAGEPKPPVQDPPAPPEDAPEDVVNFVPQEFDIDKGEPKPPKSKEPKEHTSAIRKELEKVASDKKAVDEELQRLRDQMKTEETARKELETKLVTVGTEYEEFKKKNSIGNPRDIKEVRDIIEPYNTSVDNLRQEIELDGGDGAALEGWLEKAVPAYMRACAVNADGKRDDEKYRAEIERIRSEASNQFGQDFTREVMKHVRTGAENAFAVSKVVREVQSNIPAHHYREAMRIYEAEATEFAEVERSAFNPPDDIKLNDPLNVSVILRAMIDGSEEVKKVAQNAKLATKIGMLPIKPVDPGSVEPERLQDVITTALSNHQKHFKKIRSILPEALVARAILPALWSELETLRAQVKGERQVPKPNLDGPQDQQMEYEEQDVKEFEPSNPALEEFKRETKRR